MCQFPEAKHQDGIYIQILDGRYRSDGGEVVWTWRGGSGEMDRTLWGDRWRGHVEEVEGRWGGM